jgi:hypothetical protein
VIVQPEATTNGNKHTGLEGGGQRHHHTIITPVSRVDQASAGIATVRRADRAPSNVYLRRAEEERGHVPQANAQHEGGRVLVLGAVQQVFAAR